MPQIKIGVIAKDLNVSHQSIFDYLDEIGVAIEKTPNSRVDGHVADRIFSHFRQKGRDLRHDAGATKIAAEATRVAADATMVASDATKIAAEATSIASDATSIAADATSVAQKGRRHGSGNSLDRIPVLDSYTIGGITYTVDRQASAKTLAKKSGEARILVVDNGDRKYVLKLYIPGHGPEHFVLDRVQKATGGFLVALRAHGKWTAPQSGQQLDYEVMDYMPYGSLADTCLRGFENRFKEVALRMAFAIRQCHSLGVIHRDIKPENFLYTSADKKDFVMIDFGIARGYSGDNRPVKVDAAKSSYFVSPEGAISSTDRTTYVGPATDYYSMGMTLLALWMGTDNFYRMFPPEELAELDRLKRNNNVIGKLRPKLNMSDHCASLLERLLEFSDNSRAGFDEVQRWYKGETLKTGSAAEAESATSAFRVVFNEVKRQIARSPEELARLMLGDVEFAKKFLYKGLAKSALQGIRPTLAIEIDDITQARYPRPDQQGMGVYAAALLLDPSMIYTGVKGDKCTTPKQIAADVWKNADKYFGAETKTVGGISPADRLWVYLTIRGDSKIKTYPDKYRPIIKKSSDNGVFALVHALDPDMPLHLQGKPFSTKTEIAVELWRDRTHYAKALTDRNHPYWIIAAHGGAKESDISFVIRTLQKGGVAALYEMCLMLDPKFPLYSDDGKRALRTQNDIAAELLEEWIWKKDELARADHPLWSYLKHFGGQWKTIGETYPAKVAADGNTWLWDLYYRLGNGRKAYNVQYNDDQKWHYVYNLDELAKAANEHGLTDFTMQRLSLPHFATWLAANDCAADTTRSAVAEKLVKDLGPRAASNGWYLLYSLLPDIDMRCLKKVGEYDPYRGYTAADLGGHLNLEISEKRGYYTKTTAKRMIDMLQYGPDKFRNSQMGQYMRARKMDKYIDGICKIIDIQANAKAHPSVPYTIKISLWKVVQYLGHKPTFYFEKADKRVDSLTALKSIPASQRREASSNEYLQGFVSLFFHENVNTSFSIDRAYDCLEFMDTYDVGNAATVNRFRHARTDTAKAVADRDSAWASIRRTRMIIACACLIPLAIVLGWMIGMSFSDGSGILVEAFKAIGHWVGILLGIVGVLAGCSGGIVGAIVGGLAGYWIPVWVFGLLSGAAPFVVSALLAGAAVWCAVNLFKQGSDPKITSTKTYDRLVSQCKIYCVTYAYGTTTAVFGSSLMPDPCDMFKSSTAAAAAQKKTMRKAALGMVGLAALTVVIGILLMSSYEKTEAVYEPASESVEEYVMMADIGGDYEGTFHERPSTLTLECDGSRNIKGTVTIGYSTPMVQELQGTYYPSDQSFILHQTVNGKERSGVMYQGHFRKIDGRTQLDGHYTNISKGTNHQFSFEKVPYQE